MTPLLAIQLVLQYGPQVLTAVEALFQKQTVTAAEVQQIFTGLQPCIQLSASGRALLQNQFDSWQRIPSQSTLKHFKRFNLSAGLAALCHSGCPASDSFSDVWQLRWRQTLELWER